MQKVLIDVTEISLKFQMEPNVAESGRKGESEDISCFAHGPENKSLTEWL